ncbi:MAG: DUF2505 domain-containing protein [Alphaproteobacteria bacterium]|nr:DUF2505 domain-containing protein [Alphaproteobacteria bacterium]
MQIELRHHFDAPPARAWEILFGDAYEDAVAQHSRIERRILEDADKNGKRVRRIHVTPAQTLPAAVSKLLGTGRLSYVLEEHHRADVQKMDFTVTVDALPDKVSVKGSWSLTPSATGCDRLVTIDVTVRVPIVGRKIEEQVVGDLRKSYDDAAVFAQKWIREHA